MEDLKRRGRPKKHESDSDAPTTNTTLGSATVPTNKYTNEVIVIQKKSRKKPVTMASANNVAPTLSIMPAQIQKPLKKYIVQLKVTADDLSQIQTQFNHKITDIGYTPKPHFTLRQGYQVEDQNQDPTYPIMIPINSHHIPIKLLDKITEPLPLPSPQLKLESSNSKCTCNSQKVGGGVSTASDTNRNLGVLLNHYNQQWPESSTYACWNCDSLFSTRPMGIIDRESNGKFYGHGNFCGFPCVARYLADREPDQYFTKYSLLCLAYQAMYNLPLDAKVPLAPPREAHQRLGGKLSDTAYRSAHTNALDTTVYQFPLIPVMLQIAEMNRSLNINQLVEANGKIYEQKLAENKLAQSTKKTNKVIPMDLNRVTQSAQRLSAKQKEQN
jgi:hypothetical protein